MPAPRTVLITETGRLGGGSFEGLYLTLQALDRSKFRPVVLFTSRTRYYDKVREMGVPTHLVSDPVLSTGINRRYQKWMEKVQEYTFCRIPPLGKCAASWCHRHLLEYVQRLCKDEQVELLYSNNQVNRSLFMPILAEQLDLPLVVHMRSPGAESFCPPKRDFVQANVTRWITISKQVENYWREHNLTAEMELIPNGLPQFQITPLDVHTEFSIPKERKVVVILARLIWEKAHEFLLEGVRLLVDTHPDVCLLIAGDGPRREHVERRIAELDLADHVVMAGYDPRGRDLAAAADLVVQPSSQDSFSRAVMEAMRVGTPTAISSKGSALEAVVPGVHSLVMEYGDAPGLAQAMQQGLFDEDIRKGLVKNGSKLISERFDLHNQTRKIEAVMEAALSAHAADHKGS